jgi:hypothetical protein
MVNRHEHVILFGLTTCTFPYSTIALLESARDVVSYRHAIDNPETEPSSIRESVRTDDVWNVKLTCQKDTCFRTRHGRLPSTDGMRTQEGVVYLNLAVT